MKYGIAIAILSLSIALAGCAPKKPISYRFSGCLVTGTSTDSEGHERKDCDCRNGVQVGWDAKTQARIIKCEP